jgi:gliding motility-associated-like protein
MVGKLMVLAAVTFSSAAFAQSSTHPAHSHAAHEAEHDLALGDSLDGFDPNTVMQRAFAKGLQPNEAAMYLARAKRQYITKKYNLPRTPANRDLASLRVPNAVASVPCTNMDFEQGNMNGWTGFIGDNSLNSNGPLQNIQPGFFSNGVNAPVTDQLARHTIMQVPGSGVDPCGGFPAVYPGGNYSVRLGNNWANYQGEAIEQTFTVGAGNTSFTYSYAVVLNDGGHSAGEQPYFRIEMYDQSGNLIPCGQYYVEASGAIPGFISCGVGTFYKPWTTVNADLTAYLTQTVTIRFTAAGCIYAGHYGYAYVDASCQPYVISLSDSLCQGSSITLSAPVGATDYLWTTGDTSQSIVISTPGPYSVDMTSVTGCHTTLTVNVYAYPQPIADFTPVYAPCSQTYTFSDSSTLSSGVLHYYWDFGDPALTTDTSTLASPTFTFPNPGTFTVTLVVVTDNGCTDTATAIVTPANGGQAAFTATSVCVGQPTQFTDQSNSPTAWDWDFGDPLSGPADSSALQNPSHTFTAAGTYTVTLVAATPTPCPSIVAQVVNVAAIPSAGFSYSQVCGTQTVSFTDTSIVGSPSTITGVTWNFGDPASGNNTSTSPNPTHVFSGPGMYTVTLTANSNASCSNTVTQVITVGVQPVAAFTANTVCTNSPMQFNNQSQNTGSWYWDFGVATSQLDTSTAQNPSFTYTLPGNYTVMLIGNPGSCPDTATVQVSVAPGPQVQFLAPNVCFGEPFIFTDQTSISTGSITDWYWDFGLNTSNADTSVQQHPTFNYPSSGTYTVTLTATSNNGCVTTATQQVTVDALPSAFFSSNVVCVGSPTSFNDMSVSTSGPITQWTWDFGDNTPTASQQHPTHIYGNDTTYTVTLIVQNSAGCRDTITMQATTAPMPVIQFVGDTLAGCPLHCVNFTESTTIASGSITGWTWDFGDNSGPVYTQNPSHCFDTPGFYTVSLSTTSNLGCSSTLVIPQMIEVYPSPTASFMATPQLTTVVNTHVNFIDLSQGSPVSWLWDFGDPSTTTDVSGTQNPDYTYSNEYGSTYPVYLQVTNQYGCVDDTTLEVIVEPEFTFFIPNAFTPNRDGVNDGFYGTGIGISTYTIWIFDRWGNLIFTSNDMNEAWDGTVQGKAGNVCQQDVYVWKVVLTDVFGKKRKYIGHVSLIL